MEREKVTIKKGEQDFKFLKLIGEGSFSSVFLSVDSKSGKEYAIKVCDKKFILKEKKQEYIKREKAALLRLTNKQGVIQLVCTFTSETKLFFVLTYAKNNELFNYIKYMNLECARFYAAELLIAIENIHKCNIIHRDLKPQNIFLNSLMHILIGDFGSSKILPDEAAKDITTTSHSNINNNDEDNTGSIQRKDKLDRRSSFVGSALYVPPEILKGKKSNFSSDLFSYGCILYEMIAKKPPFGNSGENEFQIFKQIQNSEYEFPDNFDIQAKDLVSKLLITDSSQRLGAHDGKDQLYQSIRNHPFFSKITFKNLFQSTSPMLKLSDLQKDDHVHAIDDIETGLGENQLKRILELELNLTSSASSSNQESLEKLLEDQKKIPWSEYVEENEYIIKYGFVHKRKGLFSRKRMLVLTNKPRLIYIDATANVKKGEIPFDSSLVCEPRNFKIFFIHTPNRVYFLESEGEALKWCEAIDKVRDKYCIND